VNELCLVGDGSASGHLGRNRPSEDEASGVRPRRVIPPICAAGTARRRRRNRADRTFRDVHLQDQVARCRGRRAGGPLQAAVAERRGQYLPAGVAVVRLGKLPTQAGLPEHVSGWLASCRNRAVGAIIAGCRPRCGGQGQMNSQSSPRWWGGHGSILSACTGSSPSSAYGLTAVGSTDPDRLLRRATSCTLGRSDRFLPRYSEFSLYLATSPQPASGSSGWTAPTGRTGAGRASPTLSTRSALPAPRSPAGPAAHPRAGTAPWRRSAR